MKRGELTIGNRYRLLDRLGEGGMGAVYRALDRLTGETVALKHVALVPGQLQFASQSDQDPTLALAQEFQVLSSLRHPHSSPCATMALTSSAVPSSLWTCWNSPAP